MSVIQSDGIRNYARSRRGCFNERVLGLRKNELFTDGNKSEKTRGAVRLVFN